MTQENKIPSPELLSLVNEWADSYIKSTELPVKILEAAQAEGLNKQQIRKIVEDVLVKRGLSERRIREVLPSELKDMTKTNIRNSNAALSAASPEQAEDDDVEFLKKRLAKYVDDSRLKEVIIENKEKEIGQLQEALKKTSFEPATEYKPPPPFQWPEPDEDNTFVFKDITFDAFRLKLGPLKAGGNTKINVYLERVR